METWTDHKGVTRPVVRHKGVQLKYEYPSHAALRAFIFVRDNFTCRHCGDRAFEIPDDYNGRYTLRCNNLCLVLDHILSIRRGGTHRPDNLQTLCDSCNARKACLVEGAGGRRA